MIDAAITVFKKALQGRTFPVRPIQLMLIDFHMPMKTGLEVIQDLRQFISQSQGKLLPPKFVIFTEFATPSFKRILMNLDVNAFFEKPIGKRQLESLLDEIVAQQSLESQSELE